MRLVSSSAPHLAVCVRTPADTWTGIYDVLRWQLPAIKRAISPDTDLGITLQMPALAAFELYEPANIAALRQLLREHGLYVFSLDGFYFGRRGLPPDVRDNLHVPDWRDLRRMCFTNVLADILAELLPEDIGYGSVNTIAIGARGNVEPADIALAARNVLRFAAYLASLRERTGKTITLALEPGPGAVMETAAGTGRFFGDYLFSAIAEAQFSVETGLPIDDAAVSLRRHLGVALDLSHAAALYESPGACMHALRNAGVRIAKVQVSNALSLRDAALGRRLLQAGNIAGIPVVERRRGELRRYRDVRSAFAVPMEVIAGREWRIPCHVPASLNHVGPFTTTRSFTSDFLQLQAARRLTSHVEIDPAMSSHRSAMPGAYYAREYDWVRNQLGGASNRRVTSRRGRPNLRIAG